MKTVVIFGAASGLGAAMVEYFYHQDCKVIAVARNPQKKPKLAELSIESLACDAVDEAQVKQTVAALPSDAWVISTMGSYKAEVPVDYIGHRNLINALEANEIKRFLLVTSLGCGDSWQYLSERAKQGFGFVLRDKSLAESWLQTSTLDYTILRPGGLKDGDVTEQGVLSQGVETHGVITRSEVARLAHQLLVADDSLGQIYQCVDPNLTY
ncbi:flavin reductase [Photobacterium jeanii]|uniref:Flavin reductase n=1 Tax=Photobacterium jeanii TaxID=858640 RepID=A0A178K7N0_9GAMM|nr:SDR family NAD(P)-dependent oxidoreductase [Photobacterium jeanii]OAN13348.1 flavin reductase [Photobacterium jeanii]PST90347.1 flavin reductase [Photobacterium jeanii]